MTVEILESAKADLRDGRLFYERQGGSRLGSYFFNTLFAEIDSLVVYAGVHPQRYGFYWTMPRHFPYSIYYKVEESIVKVYAIIDNRRNPSWIFEHLDQARCEE